MKTRSLRPLLVVVLLSSLLAAQQEAPPQDANANLAPAPATTPPVKHSPEGYPILEDGTPIKLRLTRTLSSAEARTGDRVDFQVVDPIVLDGVTVVPQGSIAWGTITEAQRKRRMGRGGKLAVQVESVRLANSEKARLRAVREAQGKGHVGVMSGAMVGTAIVFLPAAPLFLLMHGKDVKIPEGTEVTAYIDGDTVFPTAAAQPEPAAEQQAPPPEANPEQPSETQPEEAQPQEAQPAEAAAGTTEVTVTSVPAGAEIEVDGAFVGNTPSSIDLAGGNHSVRITKDGYQPYERQLHTMGGSISLDAPLRPAQ